MKAKPAPRPGVRKQILLNARTPYLDETPGPEDQGLCESVQRGLESKFCNQGRFMVDPQRSGTAEHGVHHFHRPVMEALETSRLEL